MENGNFTTSENKIKLSEVLNFKTVLKSLEDLYNIIQLPIAMAIIDINGKVLMQNGISQICADFHKMNPNTLSLCIKSDCGSSKGVPAGGYKIYKCPNGIYDMVTPIIINGEHFGNILVGQFLFENEKIDMEYYRSQAERYGFDSEKYLKALNKLPVMSLEKANNIMTYVSNFGNMLSALGLKNVQLSRGISENKALLESLKQSEEKYRILVENQTDFVIRVGMNGLYSYVSPSFCKFLGVEEKNLLGKHIFKNTYGEDLSMLVNAVENMVRPPYMVTHEERMITNRGLRWVQWTSTAVLNEKGEVISTMGTGRDIDEKKRLEDSLKATQAQQAAMVANIIDVLVIADEKYTVKYVSPNIKKLFGWEPEEVLGLNILQNIHPDDANRAARLLKLLMSENSHTKSGVFKYYTKSRVFREVLITAVNLIDDPYVKGIMINFHDITALNRRLDKIRYLSYRDVLTKLYNRAFFEVELKRLNEARICPVSVIICDVNGLKLINDGFGHNEGDRVLKQIAKIISECSGNFGPSFHFGGDEFYVMLPGSGFEKAQKISQNIKEKCEDFNLKSGSHIKLSLSSGYDVKTDPSENLMDTFKRAEAFMYRNKLLESRSTHGLLISAIKTAMNEKSHETQEHAERIAKLALSLGRNLGLGDEQLNQLELLAHLHDIGKMSIDNRILNKTENLTEEEWFEIKKHPEAGYRIALTSPDLVQIAEFILCHHEHWDGNGYPQGLKGESIPLLSRIVSVVDSYDAMISDRIYRRAKSKRDAIEEIKEKSGTQFDPHIAKAFLEIIE